MFATVRSLMAEGPFSPSFIGKCTAVNQKRWSFQDQTNIFRIMNQNKLNKVEPIEVALKFH